MKSIKYIAITIIIIVIVLVLKTCTQNVKEENRDNKSVEPKKQEQELLPNLIKSSSTYLTGKWELKYTDIIHYSNDEIGTPRLNLNDQSKSYSFNHVGETLVLEEEYPVLITEYNDQKFSLEVDLKIVHLVIIGELIDNNNWKGTFEYIGEGGEILSSCSVKAKRR